MSNLDGWRELESDPGLFTLLIEDMGINEVEVEEVYDLSRSFHGDVYGFIFLFKWNKDRRTRRKMQEQLESEQYAYDTAIVDKIFFAQQLIPNSCATHALLSVLLNSPNIKVGEALSEFRQFTKDHNPEVKGLAIGNVSKLARAHNSHSRPETVHAPSKGSIGTGQPSDSFHFVSYLPIDNHLYELDGLKPYPIDHGALSEDENWTEMFRRVIRVRLGMETDKEPHHDIRYNLMSIVADKRIAHLKKIYKLIGCQNMVKAALAKVKKVLKESHSSSRNRSGRKSERANEQYGQTKLSKEVNVTADQNIKATAEGSLSMANGTVDNCKIEASLHSKEVEDFCVKENFKMVSENKDAVKKQDHNEIDGIANLLPSNFTNIVEPIENNVHNCQNDVVAGSINQRSKRKRLAKGGNDTFKAKKAQLRNASNEKKVLNGINESIINNSVLASLDKENLPNILKDQSFLDENRVSLLKGHQTIEMVSSTKEVIDSVIDILKEWLEELNLTRLDYMIDEGAREDHIAIISKYNTVHREHNYAAFTADVSLPAELKLLQTIETELQEQIDRCEKNLSDEIEKRKKYALDKSRRTHNYDPFISTFLKVLAKMGLLSELIEQNYQLSKRKISYGKTGDRKKTQRRSATFNYARKRNKECET